jgi:hypothetical protein
MPKVGANAVYFLAINASCKLLKLLRLILPPQNFCWLVHTFFTDVAGDFWFEG